MARTVVHLMRHGEVFNPDGVLYGRAPGFHLSQRGEAMAQQVADVLLAGGHDIRAVIHSPLERAEETAAPTARAFGVALQADPRLIEAGNLLEGLPVNAPVLCWLIRATGGTTAIRTGPLGGRATGSRQGG